MKRRSPWSIGILALVLAACGSSPSGSPSASAAAGGKANEPSPTPSASGGQGSVPDSWTVVNVDEEGYSLALPEEWITASADDLADTGVFDDLAEQNPEARAALEQAKQGIENGSVSFFAFETGRRTERYGFATNVNVVNVPNPGTATPRQVADQMASALPLQIPGLEVIRTDALTLPAGEAALVESTWTLQQESGLLALRLTQYLILAGDTGYVLSMTSPDASADRYADVWPDVAGSFTVD